MPTITIELTALQAARLETAWLEYFGTTITQADVKTHLVRELKAIVIHGEKQAADKAAQSPASFDPS